MQETAAMLLSAAFFSVSSIRRLLIAYVSIRGAYRSMPVHQNGTIFVFAKRTFRTADRILRWY
jgi:hypothetical protein